MEPRIRESNVLVFLVLAAGLALVACGNDAMPDLDSMAPPLPYGGEGTTRLVASVVDTEPLLLDVLDQQPVGLGYHRFIGLWRPEGIEVDEQTGAALADLRPGDFIKLNYHEWYYDVGELAIGTALSDVVVAQGDVSFYNADGNHTGTTIQYSWEGGQLSVFKDGGVAFVDDSGGLLERPGGWIASPGVLRDELAAVTDGSEEWRGELWLLGDDGTIVRVLDRPIDQLEAIIDAIPESD